MPNHTNENASYRRAVDLLEADLENEMVALEPTLGQCFGFNEVAKDVWRALAVPQSFGDLKSGLLEQYDVSEAQCAAELSELLDDMVASKLIERVDHGANGDATSR
jgi:hypothetical protein